MTAGTPAKDRLAEFCRALSALEPGWANWGKFECWIAGVRPLVRRSYPSSMADFNEAARKPKWLSLPRKMDCWTEHRADRALHQELATNNQLVEQTKSKLLAFLDGLRQRSAEVREKSHGKRRIRDARRVFVIHGTDALAVRQLARFLAALDLEARSLFEVGGEVGANPNLLRILRRGMRQAAAVLVLLTPEEWPVFATAEVCIGPLDEVSNGQARAIFGMGLALGVAARRTILVALGSEMGPFAGFRHVVKLDNERASRDLLRQKLKAVGCVANLHTDAHLNKAVAGDFSRWLVHAQLNGTTP